MAEVIRLNDRWRVTDDGVQWILSVRCGRKSTKRSGWTGRRFHRQRTPLIASVTELCGSINTDALAIIQALPDCYGLSRTPRTEGWHD